MSDKTIRQGFGDLLIKADATVFKFQKIVAAAGPTHEPAREQHQGWGLGDNEEPIP